MPAEAGWRGLLVLRACALLLLLPIGCGRSVESGGEALKIEVQVGESFAFNPGVIHCRSDQDVRIHISNAMTDGVSGSVPPHTLVVLQQGADVEGFASAALQASESEHYVPAAFRQGVIASSPLIQSGESAEVSFRAPQQPGDYPFVCSFPGHCMLGMRGVLSVR